MTDASDDFTDFYTRHYEEVYSREVVAHLHELFNDERITEAFFALNAQADALLQHFEVTRFDSKFRTMSSTDWTIDLVLDYMDEGLEVAYEAFSPCWPTVGALVHAMRAMVTMGPHAPPKEFIEEVEDPTGRSKLSQDPQFMETKKTVENRAVSPHEVMHMVYSQLRLLRMGRVADDLAGQPVMIHLAGGDPTP